MYTDLPRAVEQLANWDLCLRFVSSFSCLQWWPSVFPIQLLLVCLMVPRVLINIHGSVMRSPLAVPGSTHCRKNKAVEFPYIAERRKWWTFMAPFDGKMDRKVQKETFIMFWLSCLQKDLILNTALSNLGVWGFFLMGESGEREWKCHS